MQQGFRGGNDDLGWVFVGMFRNESENDHSKPIKTEVCCGIEIISISQSLVLRRSISATMEVLGFAL